MTKISILGAGIVGLSIASQLPKDYDITIYSKHLPGDDMNKEYPSQWAGAIWLGLHKSGPDVQKMQLSAFTDLWTIALKHPESSARIREITEILDYGSKEDVWYNGKVPGFRFVPDDELPKGAKFGVTWYTVIVTPPVFLEWMGKLLKQNGVKFERYEAKKLGDLKEFGHDILINASGFGSIKLADVQDTLLRPMRQQNLLIRDKKYNRLYIRRGHHGFHSTAFSRHDGTVFIGAHRTEGSWDFTPSVDQRKKIIRQQHECQPDDFPSPNIEDYDFVGDHVGIYPLIPYKNGSIRLELEVIDGQNILHAYGPESGGYVYSFGLAREVCRKITKFVDERPFSSKL